MQCRLLTCACERFGFISARSTMSVWLMKFFLPLFVKFCSYGDMVCLSRCPPTASAAPGQNCYTLPDASDPCCNITVCDEPSLDPEQGRTDCISSNPILLLFTFRLGIFHLVDKMTFGSFAWFAFNRQNPRLRLRSRKSAVKTTV